MDATNAKSVAGMKGGINDVDRSADGLCRAAGDSRDRCCLCHVHLRRGGAEAAAGGELEQLSSYAVISYTENWFYVGFAAAGSWIGAFVSISFLHRPPGGPPVGAGPE
jgi:hypothetical protein